MCYSWNSYLYYLPYFAFVVLVLLFLILWLPHPRELGRHLLRSHLLLILRFLFFLLWSALLCLGPMFWWWLFWWLSECYIVWSICLAWLRFWTSIGWWWCLDGISLCDLSLKYSAVRTFWWGAGRVCSVLEVFEAGILPLQGSEAPLKTWSWPLAPFAAGYWSDLLVLPLILPTSIRLKFNLGSFAAQLQQRLVSALLSVSSAYHVFATIFVRILLMLSVSLVLLLLFLAQFLQANAKLLWQLPQLLLFLLEMRRLVLVLCREMLFEFWVLLVPLAF